MPPGGAPPRPAHQQQAPNGPSSPYLSLQAQPKGGSGSRPNSRVASGED